MGKVTLWGFLVDTRCFVLIRIYLSIVLFSAVVACMATDSHNIKGLTSIPINDAIGVSSKDQKMLLDTEGPPHFVWRGRLGIITWAYCSKGVPILICDFDTTGQLLGLTRAGGDKKFCPTTDVDSIGSH